MMRSAGGWFVAMLSLFACGTSVDLGNGAAGTKENVAAGGNAGTVGTGGNAGTGGAVQTGAGGASPGTGGAGSVPATISGVASYVEGSPVPAACTSTALAALSIAFDSNRSDLQWDILQMRADGTQVTTLVGGPYDEREPAASPDGTRLAYVSNRYGAYQIMVRDLATAVDTKITSMPQGARQPSWSSDGQMIVFTTDEATYSADEAGSIYVVQSREGATPTLVLAGGSPGTGTQWEYPSFAPGDASIVANTDVLVEAFLDGRPRRTIVSWNGQPSEATLSPDGRRVIVGGGCAPVGRQLSMVRFDGAMGDMCANGTLLTNLGFAVRHPAWGPQGLVAFDGGNGTADVYLLVLGDGTTAPIICRITKAYSMNRNATWFPTK